MRISRIARSYLTDLDQHGYPGRARLWEEFVCQSFAIYIAIILIWSFGWLKGVTVLNLALRIQAASAGVTKLKPWSAALAVCGGFSAIGFLVVNNLVGIDWGSQHVRTALPTSNMFFLTYDIQMLFSCIMASNIPSFSILYCLDLEVSKINLQESQSDE